jgi:hypothetical protein
LYKKANVYISLIVAMLGGRIIGGAANAVLLGIAGKAYGLTAFVTTMFVTALPGIFIQLGLIPLLVIALTRARLINDPKVKTRSNRKGVNLTMAKAILCAAGFPAVRPPTP